MVEGIWLGCMTWVGLACVYKKLSPKIQLFAQNHPLLTDVVCAVFFYEFMGLTLTAHFSVAVMSMLTMAGLHVQRNKKDFEFLFDWFERAKSKVSELVQQLKDKSVELNADYKAAQLNRQSIEADCS